MSIQTAEPQRADWKWVTLADVAKVVTGNTPPTADAKNYGDAIPFVKPTELVDRGIRFAPAGLADQALSKARVVPAGAVLVSCIGNLGKTGLAKVPVAFNQQINAVVFNESVIPEFGFYYAQTLKSWLYGESSATTLPIVNKGKFQQAPFPLAPLDEQREIVAEIEKQFSRLDEAVANLKRVKANLKRYKASVLKDAVEGRLVPTEAELARRDGRAVVLSDQLVDSTRIDDTQMNKPGRHKRSDDSQNYSEKSPTEGWSWMPVEALAKREPNSICAGPFGTIFKAKDFRSKGIPIIFLRHVGPLRYLTHKPGFMDSEKWEELFKPYSVYGGELLITKLGEPPGVCATYPGGIGPAMVTPDVIKLSVDPAIAVSDYVMYYFNSEPAKRFATGAAFGTTRTRLTIPLFRKMPFPLPPLGEQYRIVAEVDRRLSLIRGVEAEVDANLKRAQALKQATLAQAFADNRSGR